jgi:hypothetical protein
MGLVNLLSTRTYVNVLGYTALVAAADASEEEEVLEAEVWVEAGLEEACVALMLMLMLAAATAGAEASSDFHDCHSMHMLGSGVRRSISNPIHGSCNGIPGMSATPVYLCNGG